MLKRGAKHSARSLKISPKVTFPDQRSTRLPLAGRIAAGLPIEAVEDLGTTLDLDELLDRRGETFVLQVTGDSMIGDHICDGDYVICERRTTAHNGETVVALLPDGEATLKRFYREGGQIRLQPANEAFEPIFLKDVQIQGVVIGLLRTL
jgi:repressor LexA